MSCITAFTFFTDYVTHLGAYILHYSPHFHMPLVCRTLAITTHDLIITPFPQVRLSLRDNLPGVAQMINIKVQLGTQVNITPKLFLRLCWIPQMS